MKYSVWIREDVDGNDISREKNTASMIEHAAEAARILNKQETAVALLFQQGAILEVSDSKNVFIGLKVIGMDDSKKIRKLKDKTDSSNRYVSRGFITSNTKGGANCMFAVKMVLTGFPG